MTTGSNFYMRSARRRDERRDVTNLVKDARHFVVLDCVTTYGTISAKQDDLRDRGM